MSTLLPFDAVNHTTTLKVSERLERIAYAQMDLFDTAAAAAVGDEVQSKEERNFELELDLDIIPAVLPPELWLVVVSLVPTELAIPHAIRKEIVWTLSNITAR
jgi:hypothetical protein